MPIYARILSGLYAVVLILIIVTAFLRIVYAGYPDGHLTDYESAVQLPLITCNVVNAIAVIFFLRECFRRNVSLMTVCIAIVIHVVFLLSYTMGLDWYYKEHLGLDYGQGG
jgi:hypothetical protein